MSIRDDEFLLKKTMPNTQAPLFVIVILLVGMVLIYMGYLGKPDKLLGSPLPENEYLQYIQHEKPANPSNVARPADSTTTPPASDTTPAAPGN